ncbi:pilus assembly protein CpaF [Aliidongia dinghuensis]|uniref:Pilus assembly protein CpaF n=1 Tax=Aliidongia dinghuensis TaxID=1867774 RepID=A0A8J2YUG4_9PROT|nr:CpaF family protein [Aliidongia dinghuensis]GGF19572.1 pilus assembly protein CpaF [Aliidongia dinghuensis]
MMKSSFGRRYVETDTTAIAPPPEQPAKPAEDQFQVPVMDETRRQIRDVLFTRIEPTAAIRLSADGLRAEISRLASEICNEQRIQLNAREEERLVQELLDDMVGLGPLEPLLADEAITDIMVNGPNNVWVERRGKLELVPVRFRDNQHVANIAQRIAASVGRRVDEASPICDARLADGSRVNILLPPLALCGPTLSIRKFSRRAITFDMMARQGNLSEAMARFLEIAAKARLNILVSGGTGSGKTTLMNAMSRAIDHGERIVTIEDAAELRLQQPHVVPMETRPANLEGNGEINQRDLLKNALRMRPDRIIVGETRGAEAFDMLQAMNTGHDGSMSTVHANTPRDALSRVENMVLMASVGLPSRAIKTQIVSAVDLIVQIERMRDGIRRIVSIMEVIGLESEVITTQELFAFRYEGETREGMLRGSFVCTGYRPQFLDKVAQFGLERRLLEIMGIEG